MPPLPSHFLVTTLADGAGGSMQGDWQEEALEGPLLTQAGGASELASLTQQAQWFLPCNTECDSFP